MMKKIEVSLNTHRIPIKGTVKEEANFFLIFAGTKFTSCCGRDLNNDADVGRQLGLYIHCRELRQLR